MQEGCQSLEIAYRPGVAELAEFAGNLATIEKAGGQSNSKDTGDSSCKAICCIQLAKRPMLLP